MDDTEGEPHRQRRLGNGLTVLVEPVEGAKAAAVTLMLPAGAALEPDDRLGLAGLTCGLTTRGAGDRDSRALALAFDELGVQRAEAAEARMASFTQAMLAEQLGPALELLADTVRRPTLPAEHLDFLKASALQELEVLEDDPTQKLFVRLLEQVTPWPLGRSVLDHEDHIEAATVEDAAAFHRRHYVAGGAVLAVAGAVEPERVFDFAERLFGDWETGAAAAPTLEPPRHQPVAETTDKQQTHFAVAFPAAKLTDADWYAVHGLSSILGGGMSSRLWTEVRERRGLCYSVGTFYRAIPEIGVLVAYAGVPNDKAALALEVMLAEFARINAGIDADELDRAKAGLKSSLVMAEESTAARATMIARSQVVLGRVRTVAEVAAGLEALTVPTLMDYLGRHPFGAPFLASIGQTPLELPKC